MKRIIYFALCAMVSGCQNMNPADRACGCDTGGKYIPQKVEWMTLKLQANERIPWGISGMSYSINYYQGSHQGEIIAEVAYEGTDNPDYNNKLCNGILMGLSNATRLLQDDSASSVDRYGTLYYLKAKLIPIGDEIEKLNAIVDEWSEDSGNKSLERLQKTQRGQPMNFRK